MSVLPAKALNFAIFSGLLAISSPFATAQARPQIVDFSRDVRPILSQHCFKCHGPDDKQRAAGLRLDLADIATAKLLSGKHALVPGKPEKSELINRITTTGPLLMPPVSANKPLSVAEKAILKKWIAQGAEYKQHWAFVAPKQILPPPVKQTSWVHNPIDHYILWRLEKDGLKPSPQADKYTLIRRVSLDLTGLPPTLEETKQFIEDKRPNAYELLVDRLLASPRYGERWARRWLDLARYADTNGYEKDRQRSVWPYRDWVINAINKDMPFDQFTIEQIAGDMLPNATQDQRIATGFHRNTMLNEEGGIDPLEFRFYSMVDRNAVTGVTWLGMTVGCAQCHTHKYDPITQKEYYSMMACMDNADEPTTEIVIPSIKAERDKIEAKIAKIQTELPSRYPVGDSIAWSGIEAPVSTGDHDEKFSILPDASIRVFGTVPDTSTYTVSAVSNLANTEFIKLEAVVDKNGKLSSLSPSRLSLNGPGRTQHGNFVLTGFHVYREGPDGSKKEVKIESASADFSQDGFSASAVLDDKPTSGWAIAGTGKWNVTRTIIFKLEKNAASAQPGKWSFVLKQLYGGQHTLGQFRISLGKNTVADNRPIEVVRIEKLGAAFDKWKTQAQTKAVAWQTVKPVKAVSNSPLLTILPDASVLSSGDITKRDVYDLTAHTTVPGITAIRLEALPDDTLPNHGPGRIWYEGAPGDFFLSEINLECNGKPVKFIKTAQSYGNAAGAIDGNPQTGWSINGGQGKPHTAIFTLEHPLDSTDFNLKLLFEQYYAAGLGRFRISVTSDKRETAFSDTSLLPDAEALLLIPDEKRTAEQNEKLLNYFLSVAPEMQSTRDEIARLRASMPAYPTALTFSERPPNNPRLTYVHNRGEWLQPKEKVEPGVFAFLHQMPKEAKANRLTFARWLVDRKNPLVARVVMNRQWAALFGKGIVTTTEDFGYQGQLPSHPELLDWLAVEFMKRGWSMKQMHRLIVTSSTYKQSSRVSPELLAKDPQNRLLSRGARVRLDAELVRDLLLRASGLLSNKIGGPSVFPPQPAGVTSEGTYGPLSWTVSMGEDRYRRGMYTFSKRTAPYAMFATFDGPSGEACLARREVSNTPLQALTLMNDMVVIETAQSLGKIESSAQGTVAQKITDLFQRCATRPPVPQELEILTRFYEKQKQRFMNKELDAASITGMKDGDISEIAAWTVTARAIINLDEVITKR